MFKQVFFYKNLFYKNVEAEISQNFKKVLRTFLRLRVDEQRFYFAHLYFKWKHKIKVNTFVNVN